MSAATPTGSSSALLSISGLSFFYGQNQILDDLRTDVMAGEFLCIVGPSGAGKTTLLQCLAGLRRPTSGSVVFQDKPVNSPPQELAVVFQDYSRSLLPWMSTLGNVALPLKSAGVDKRTRTERSMQALEEVGLTGHERKYPWELSGGMQQRVAIARALAYQPKLIIMDEPFASVDAQTRSDLEDLTLRVRRRLGVSVVLVTHDIDEAVYLADRVMVLAGRPARVAAMITTDLGAERDQIATKESPAFAEHRSAIYRLIKRPVAAEA